MGVSVSEHSIFYSADVNNLEELRKFLINQCKECEEKEFGREINFKTEGGEELFGWNISWSEIQTAKNPDDGFEFKFFTEQKSHSNFHALRELCQKYNAGICFYGGSAEAGGYQTYDPEGRYFPKMNFDEMRFSKPSVYILFERLANCGESIEDLCENVHNFFRMKELKHGVFKINEDAFYVRLNWLPIGSPFISPTLEEIKTGLKALSSSLYLWTTCGAQKTVKFSLYFYIDNGTSVFKDLQPGSVEWAQAEESFEYEGDFVDITNDKEGLFFSAGEFANILDYSIVTCEKESVVEEIKQIDRKKCQLLFQYPQPKKSEIPGKSDDFAGIPF